MFSPRVGIITLVLLFVTQTSWTQEGCADNIAKESLPHYILRDSSKHGSPIQIAGYVSFEDSPAENVRAYWVDASARNVSRKGISAWSASIEASGGTGPSLLFISSHDYFFTGDVLAPSQREGVSEQSCPIRLVLGFPSSESPIDTDDASAPPTASVEVQFVQFRDGSIWGDRDEAAKFQLERRETLDKVKSLQQVYSEQGEKAFMDALAEATALACFERIKTLCRNENSDSSCARKGIAEMLTIATRQRKLEGHSN